MSLLSFGFSRKKRGAEDVPGGDAQESRGLGDVYKRQGESANISSTA